MSTQDSFGVRFTQSWLAFYTRGLPEPAGERRRAEMASDLWEQLNDKSTNRASTQVLDRCVRGIPADVWWRYRTLLESRTNRERNPFMFGSIRRMIKGTLFKQTWWVSLAVVLAGLQIVIAIYIGLVGDASATFVSVWGGGAALAVLGVQQRLGHRRRGDALIALGVVPAVVIGIIAWWFPPLWFSTAGGLLVIWSSIRDAVNPVGVPVS